MSEHELEKSLGPTSDPEVFENLNSSVHFSTSSAICFEHDINNIGKQIDFGPHFSSLVAPAEQVAGVA